MKRVDRYVKYNFSMEMLEKIEITQGCGQRKSFMALSIPVGAAEVFISDMG